MKIAYIMNSYPMTSTTFIRREISALKRQGIDVLRIAVRPWNGELVDEEDRAEHQRTRYVFHDGWLPLLWAAIRVMMTRPRQFLRALALACRMSRRSDRSLPFHLAYLAEACRIQPWLGSYGIEHVHAHFGTNATEVAMLLHTLGGPPFSFTVHGPEEFDRAAAIQLAEKVRRCRFVVAVSSYGRSQLWRLVDKKYWPKVEVVRCGLDRDFFDSSASGAPPARRLVCVGRLCRQKGQLVLIEAVRRLAEEGTSFDLVLAGDGEMRGEIAALVEACRVAKSVRITGWISGADVKREILAARALVLPSLAEGLPVVLMEAMALRRSVISTYIAGIPELVTPENGWLVPAGDVEALAAAMRSCLEAPADLIAHMGEAARQSVLARHDADREAAKLAALISRAVQSRSQHEPNYRTR